MPLDRGLLKFSAELTPLDANERKWKLDEDVLTFTESLEVEPPARQLTGAQQEEEEIAVQREAEMTQARSELEESLLPGVKSFAVQAGAGLVSLGTRVAGAVTGSQELKDYSDRLIRFAGHFERATQEREKGGFPDILQRGARGAAVSLMTMAPAGMIAGPYGAIAAAVAQETNSSITQGREAGLKGRELAGYAVAQGVWEGIPASIMQRAGLGGAESMLFGKKAVSSGVKEGLKRLGITAAHELIEEIPTELGHSVGSYMANVEPGALSKENLAQTVADTTVQTLIMVGFGGAPGVARSITADKALQATDELLTHAKEGTVPSRKTWKQVGLAKELGESVGQRKAFTQELARQFEETTVEPPTGAGEVPAEQLQVAQEGIEAPAEAPAGPVETPLGEEVSEVVRQQEAVPEAPGAVDLDKEIALNKATNIKIRETVQLEELSDDAVQSMDSVMDEVATQKLDEKAMDVVDEILDAPHRKRRQITTQEHAAMVLKAGKLLDSLDVERTVQATAAQANNRSSHEQSTVRERGIVKQLDRLTTAARYSRREIARALSIGRLRLSRESYDIVDILQGAQASKGKKLTAKERDSFTQLSKENAALVEEITKLEKEVQAKEWLAEQVLAQKVVKTSKPRGKIGEGVKKKARAEQEYYKERIRQMGLRVNDITGVTTEGTYLIGRLGIAYIKEGAGTLIEVAEKLRAAMPDLNLTQQDVNQALIMRSPREVAKARSGISKRIARLTSIAGRLVKLDNLTQGISGEQRAKPEVSQELARLRKMQSELEKRLRAEEKLEAAKRGEPLAGKEKAVDSPAVVTIKAEIRKIQRLRRAEGKVAAAKEGKFPEKKKQIPTPKDIKVLQAEFSRLRNEFYKSGIDNAKLERAIETVNRLQDQLANGLTSVKESPREVPRDLADVNEQIRQLTRELRVDAELASAEEQLRTGEIIMPVKREKKPASPELERKEIQLMQKRREIRQMTSDLAGWGTGWTRVGRVTKEVAYSAKAVAATADLSFTMRQNLWQVFSHPVQAVKVSVPSLNAFFSEYSADQINNSLLNSKNAPLYELAGIAIQDASSPDARQQSEVFRGKVLERSKLPGLKQFAAVMRASSRHAVAIGNLMRTSAFDQFMADNPNATMEEMTAMADYINVSTGLGQLGSAGAIGDALQVTFFSPRFAVSRVQTPWKLAKYWKLPRVRKQIATDMARVISTGGMVLILAKLAGFEVELFDVEDPDWGKIRFRNTRIDIWGGFQQPARVLARTAMTPFVEKPKNPLETLGRFAAFKVSPIISVPIEAVTGKTAVGEDITALEAVGQAALPLVLRDVKEAFQEDGAAAAALTAALATLGIGVSTYKDSKTTTRRKIKKLKQAGYGVEAEQLKLRWNTENRDNRIVTVNI